MTHADARGMLLNIKNAPHLMSATPLDVQRSPEGWPVLFTILVDDYLDWVEHLQREGLALVNRYGQPWGVWLHVRDPAGNLICISTSDMY